MAAEDGWGGDWGFRSHFSVERLRSSFTIWAQLWLLRVGYTPFLRTREKLLRKEEKEWGIHKDPPGKRWGDGSRFLGFSPFSELQITGQRQTVRCKAGDGGETPERWVFCFVLPLGALRFGSDEKPQDISLAGAKRPKEEN